MLVWQITPSAAIGLDQLIGESSLEYFNYFLLSDEGGYAAYGNFRDFSSLAAGGIEPINAADINITLLPVSITSGMAFPFRDLLLFQSEKWAVGSGQTLHIAFTYDGTACLECAFAGSRLSQGAITTKGESTISINSHLSPNPEFDMPLSDVNQWVLSPQGPSEDVKLFPTFLTGLPSMTVRTEIILSGGADGGASLNSFSQAYVVTPLPASALFFVSAMLAMGLLRRPN